MTLDSKENKLIVLSVRHLYRNKSCSKNLGSLLVMKRIPQCDLFFKECKGLSCPL
jgi:hypothetical protein